MNHVYIVCKNACSIYRYDLTILVNQPYKELFQFHNGFSMPFINFHSFTENTPNITQHKTKLNFFYNVRLKRRQNLTANEK